MSQVTNVALIWILGTSSSTHKPFANCLAVLPTVCVGVQVQSFLIECPTERENADDLLLLVGFDQLFSFQVIYTTNIWDNLFVSVRG